MAARVTDCHAIAPKMRFRRVRAGRASLFWAPLHDDLIDPALVHDRKAWQRPQLSGTYLYYKSTIIVILCAIDLEKDCNYCIGMYHMYHEQTVTRSLKERRVHL